MSLLLKLEEYVINQYGKVVYPGKQFVIASADPGKSFHNIVKYHRHLYRSKDTKEV